MRKKVIIGLTALMVLMTGCGKEDSSKTTKTIIGEPVTRTSARTTVTSKPAEIVDYEVTYSDYQFISKLSSQFSKTPEIWVSVMIEFENTGNVPLYLHNAYFDLEDKDGYELYSVDKYTSPLLSATVIGVGEKGYVRLYDKLIDISEIPAEEYIINPKFHIAKAEQETTTFNVINDSIGAVENGVSVNGEIENLSDIEFENPNVAIKTVLFDKENKPIWIVPATMKKDDIAGGEKSTFSAENIKLSTGGVTSYLNVSDFVNYDSIGSHKTFATSYYRQTSTESSYEN